MARVDLTAGKMINRNRHLAEDVALISNGVAIASFMPLAVQQDLSGAGAASIASYYTAWTTTSTDALTLADAKAIGQLKKIQMIVDGGDSILTPANFTSGATVTFADAGDYCILIWDGSGWQLLELGNDADGATAPVLA